MNNRFINAKQFISEVRKAVYLFKNLWRENTTALLHAPRQVDKTAVALDIAAGIAASGREVLYVNTERHAEEHTELISRSSERLFIFTPQYESSEDKTDYADLVISGIEEAVSTNVRMPVVLDSVTRIAALSFGRNASPSYVMKRLVALQVRCRLSLLVIAHDTTRSTDRSLLNLADTEIPFDDDNTTETSFKHSGAPRCIPTVVGAHPVPKQYPHAVKLSRRDRRALERQIAKCLRKMKKS